jgi:hypothetical protein
MFNKFILIGIALGVVALGIFAVNSSGYGITSRNSGMMQSMMGNGMMSGMMSDVVLQDVIIKIISSQQVVVGKDSQITLLVLDKNTKKPLNDAQVIVGIEKGAPMSTMDMSGMFIAHNIGNGKYVVQFTLEDTGYYTLHTHVIPSGKSMHSMMNNHMDIGIIAK